MIPLNQRENEDDAEDDTKNSSAAVPVPRPEEIQEVYEKYAQHWRRLRAAQPRELLKETHLHYVAKWMRCAPHFAAATWIAL